MRPHFNLAPLMLAVLTTLCEGIALAAPLKIADVPLDVSLNSVNSILAVDNSGSMDFELLINGTDSGLAWLPASSTADANRYAYMFPMHVESSNTGDGNFYDYGNIPPFNAYAYFRSTAVNPLFYNPKITYKPWPEARINQTAISFSDAPSSAARTHPYFTKGSDSNSGTATTFDLTATYFGQATKPITNCSELSTSENTRNSTWTFLVKKGMSIDSTIQPSGSGAAYPVCYRITPKNGRGSSISNWSEKGAWTAVANARTQDITGGIAQQDLDVMAPYNPATFWMPDDNCTAVWPACSTDPSGKRYKRFDINSLTGSSYTLPDGTVINRNRTEELQNFANWFTYYRKRKTMMAGGMGKAFDSLQDSFRMFNSGMMPYHSAPSISSTDPKIYDFTNSDTSKNARELMGLLYTLHSEGGTPTIGTLDNAGTVYGYSGPFNNFLISKNSNDAITNSTSAEAALRCSANTAFVLTDGFGNDYKTTSSSIYEKAKIYYDDLRWWKPTSGKTMNTYGITLGALGANYNGDPDATPPATWPTPENDQPTSIDDLWRATLYSKGKLLSATNPTSLESSISSIITSMFASGTGSGLSYSGTQISATNNIVIQAGYDSGDWTGDLAAFSVYTTGSNAGYVNYTDRKWSAKELLDAKTNRYIATWSGSGGIPFTATALTQASLLPSFNTGANNDGANVVAWLRGDRSLEGTTYRKRTHLLGDIVNSTPAYVNQAFASYNYPGYSTFAANIKANRTPMVYVGANDGMLHAFRASDGQEMWAYVPKGVHSSLNALAQPAYTHKFTVDGALTAWDVQFTGTNASSSASSSADTSSSWRTVLIGGLRGGGKGFYALDITNPALAGSTDADKESNLASKVLWEFTDADMGLSFGKPQIGKTEAYGWVALLTSGYNNTDGKGYLYVVKIEDGSLIKKIPVNLTSGAAYDQVGLANVVGIVDFTSTASPQDAALLKYAYGGDLNGNVWRFDIRDANKDNWSVKKLAANLNGTGATGKAPITAAPDVALINTPGPFPSYQNAADLKTQRLMVFVGNGKLLHGDDFNSNDNDNGFYAIEDADDSLVIGEGACVSLGCLVQDGLGQASSSLGLNNWGTVNNDNLTSWWIVDKHSFTLNGVQRVKRGWYIKFSETGGERMIYAPQVFNGKVLFTTTMKTDSRHSQAGTCEQAFSASYNLSANKGGAETGYASRINLGFGIASGVSIIQLPDGTNKATGSIKGETGNDNLQCSDGKCNFAQTTGGQSVAVNGQLRRFGWREIYR